MKEILESRLLKLARKVQRWESRLRLLSWLRILSFSSIVSGAFLLYSFQIDFGISIFLLLFLISIFYIFVFLYSRCESFKARLEFKRRFLEREIARCEGNTRKLFRSSPVDEETLRSHPYARDLNVFEKEGIFSLIDTTSTDSGERLFLQNLLQENSSNQNSIHSNQALVKNFSTRKWFSYKFLRIASEDWDFFLGKKWSLSAWKNTENRFYEKRSFLRKVYPFYSPIGCFLILGSILFQTPFGVASFLLHLILFLSYRRESIQEFRKWESAWNRLRQVRLLLRLCMKFGGSTLREDLGFIETSFQKFSRSWSGLWRSPVPHFLTNVLYLHDLWILSRMKKWQGDFQEHTLEWIEFLERIDSLHPMIHLRFIFTNVSFPKIDASLNYICGKNVRHPLIPKDRCVPNPIEQIEMGKILLITGSNMSGKTTYMRTIGVNVLLGMMGGPVLAESMEFPPMKILCSVRNEDSLTEGISLFYAEVKRLSEIFRSIRKGDFIYLVLLDEILKGTNTRERYLATKEVLNQLNGQRAFTFCTTHDLDLAKLPGLILKHFTETIEGDSMNFDYKIREGIVESTNALFILKKEGVIS